MNEVSIYYSKFREESPGQNLLLETVFVKLKTCSRHIQCRENARVLNRIQYLGSTRRASKKTPTVSSRCVVFDGHVASALPRGVLVDNRSESTPAQPRNVHWVVPFGIAAMIAHAVNWLIDASVEEEGVVGMLCLALGLASYIALNWQRESFRRSVDSVFVAVFGAFVVAMNYAAIMTLVRPDLFERNPFVQIGVVACTTSYLWRFIFRFAPDRV